jgi:prevent-host-death family protein
MSSTVNMLEAKTHLSKLVEAVESGAEKEIVIARNGKPAVKIVPIVRRKRRLGLAEGKYADFSLEEFNAPDREIERMMTEGSIWPDESDDAPSR